jgi:hypothetical protein
MLVVLSGAWLGFVPNVARATARNRAAAAAVQAAHREVVATRVFPINNIGFNVLTLERGRGGKLNTVRLYHLDAQDNIQSRSDNLAQQAVAAVQTKLPQGATARFEPRKSGDGFGPFTKGGGIRVSVRGTVANQDRIVMFQNNQALVSLDRSQKAQAARKLSAREGKGQRTTILSMDNKTMKAAVTDGASSLRIVTTRRDDRDANAVTRTEDLLPEVQAEMAAFEASSGKVLTNSKLVGSSRRGRTLKFQNTYATPDPQMVAAGTTSRLRALDLDTFGTRRFKNRGKQETARFEIEDFSQDVTPTDRSGGRQSRRARMAN